MILFRAKKQLFCSMIKEIVDQHHQLRYKAKHRAELLGYTFYIVRFCYIMLSIVYPSKYPRMEQWDYFLHFFELFCTLGSGDLLYGILFVMLYVNALCLVCGLYFTRVDTPTWQILYDRVVVESDKFLECTLEQEQVAQILQNQIVQTARNHPWWPKMLCRKVCRALVWFHMVSVDRARLAKCGMRFYPSYSVELRCQAQLLIRLLNRLSIPAQIGLSRCSCFYRVS